MRSLPVASASRGSMMISPVWMFSFLVLQTAPMSRQLALSPSGMKLIRKLGFLPCAIVVSPLFLADTIASRAFLVLSATGRFAKRRSPVERLPRSGSTGGNASTYFVGAPCSWAWGRRKFLQTTRRSVEVWHVKAGDAGPAGNRLWRYARHRQENPAA